MVMVEMHSKSKRGETRGKMEGKRVFAAVLH